MNVEGSSFKTASPDWYELLKVYARKNRNNPTIAEKVLWQHLRNKALGVKFLRQHIIGDYIVDFVSPESMLIIEVDGAYHSEREQQYNDEVRANVLKRTGFCLLRFSNEEVLHNTQDTLNKIKQHIDMNTKELNKSVGAVSPSLAGRDGVGLTLFDKIWDAHVVQYVEDGPTQLYIDRLYCHEVTTPQAFDTLRDKNIRVFRPEQVVAMPDHNTPSDQQERIDDPIGRKQVETLAKNCAEFGIRHFAMGTKDNGIIHVVGPEKALSLPGMTIVCGDSHTSTHGAVGAIAMGIGTSEVAQVLASQTILQSKPKTMRINIEGTLPEGTTAKDVALYIMAQMTTSGATGYAVEYAGSTVRNMSMEGRLTLSNLSIEMGSRAGLIAPDETTFAYLKDREYAPKGEAWDEAVVKWKQLYSDENAVFDKEVTYRAEDIVPRITYGTNPGAGIAIDECIPTLEEIDEADRGQFLSMLEYMQFQPGQKLEGTPVDYCFLGACTNGRIEDFRAFASVVKGKKKADNVVAWLVPGSWLVRQQIIDEGIDKILEEAGFELRLPSCSSCLAMNPDKVPAGKLSISTSNRNFVGRQGPGARTILASPLVVAASAITGVVTDPRKL
ncbi:MAG: 3-isopropylmalate dehydratase large subunit [Bacteroidaceae bacterium]|nr:3-isopropylmalate dehydratase large subunit [Bacteroidaceae bacterium]